MNNAVFVTGAGGAAGVSVIRALRLMGVRVIAADLDPLAVGLRLGDARCLLPSYSAADFVDRVCELAAAHDASTLITTLTEEMFVLSKARDRLDAAGLAYWFSESEALENCLDKWRFAQVLSGSGVPHPTTGLASADDVPGPWIVKPRFGRGSRDIFVVDDPEDLPFVFRRVPDPIVQSRLSGREFTVDAMVGRDGQLLGAVPRWRLETKSGVSTKGETFANADVVAGVGDVLRTVGVTGPANVQGFLPEDGPPSFIEVNPRFSGALPLSLAAGADLVGEYLRALQGDEPRAEKLAFRPGVVMLRHHEEIIEG